MNRPIGEIVDSRSTEIVAQCFEHGSPPPFGGMVAVRLDAGVTLYGVIHEVRTSGIDPGSRPIVRGRDGLRDQAIYDANPDLAQVLRTELAALLVGYRDGGTIERVLPPAPPPLHWSVYECPTDDARAFAQDCSYLERLLAVTLPAVDELVAAHIRLLDACALPGDEYLLRAGRTLADLLRNDYGRLRAILDRVRPREVAR